ncbi:MAG: HEPN domain-containing protein [Syntrophothermus sp.]|uniref:HEPN domain-containing protein n=1 Tax=Syntrophothermus sp. TaxID=2736299 RepID=UPI00257AC87C|nr:HEPN domain-containing protein [Syntrophothermus sp.]NSW83933.1 HEPN domain-containing protein [Syntrophothermus sp.]
MDKQIQEWLNQSQYDLKTAEAMFKSQRNIYAVFMCHLALEKALKAVWVKTTGEIAPRTHNLLLLAKGLNLSTDQLQFLAEINTANIQTRYPENLEKAIQQYDNQLTSDWIQKSKEVILWIKAILKSTKQ